MQTVHELPDATFTDVVSSFGKLIKFQRVRVIVENVVVEGGSLRKLGLDDLFRHELHLRHGYSCVLTGRFDEWASESEHSD